MLKVGRLLMRLTETGKGFPDASRSRLLAGRLSKTLWTKLGPDTIPASLSKLTIGIPDVGPSHSWSLDHLRSLSSFPFANIRHLAIIRMSASTEGPSIDKGNNLRPVPRDVLKALTESEATEMTCLECDWWSWSADDLKVVLERCTKLKVRSGEGSPKSRANILTHSR